MLVIYRLTMCEYSAGSTPRPSTYRDPDCGGCANIVLCGLFFNAPFIDSVRNEDGVLMPNDFPYGSDRTKNTAEQILIHEWL